MLPAFKSITRSLKHRNYRLFFSGQVISLTGTWVSSVAMSWLVYRLTGSALLLAALNAAQLLPTLIVTPYAGVHVDRWSRHKVMICTQAASMLQSLALAVLTLSNTITVPQLFILAIIQGVINGFDMPARQAFVVEIIESREDLGNAIALNSAMFHGARLIGPAIGGLIIGLSSEGICFAIDTVSYLAVLIGLTRMRLPRHVAPQKSGRSVFNELREGFLYCLKFEPIGVQIIFVGAITFAFSPQAVLLPAFAKEQLNGGPEMLGALMGMSGAGALSAALYLASRKSIVGLGKLIKLSGFVLGCALIVFSQVRELWSAFPLTYLVGFASVFLIASSNTILQTLVDHSKRGRVASLFGAAFTSMMPLGALFAGWSAHTIGIRAAISIGGAVALAATAIFARRLPRMREQAIPVFKERGIIVTEES